MRGAGNFYPSTWVVDITKVAAQHFFSKICDHIEYDSCNSIAKCRVNHSHLLVYSKVGSHRLHRPVAWLSN